VADRAQSLAQTFVLVPRVQRVKSMLAEFKVRRSRCAAAALAALTRSCAQTNGSDALHLNDAHLSDADAADLRAAIIESRAIKRLTLRSCGLVRNSVVRCAHACMLPRRRRRFSRGGCSSCGSWPMRCGRAALCRASLWRATASCATRACATCSTRCRATPPSSLFVFGTTT
jgi:hypothetical protein